MSRSDALRRVLVVVPTYNERDNIEQIAQRLHAAVPDADLLVVDDASPDGTGELADRLAAAEGWVHVLHRAGKAGLGAAYVAGFGWAREQGYDVVVEMDADGSHAPEELPRLLDALEDADLVLGSRWVPGGRVLNWPRSRMVLSRGGNAWTRGMLGLPLRDATGGFRAYRRGVLDQLPLGEISSQGYCFQVDLAWQAWRRGFRVVEVPITFVERERGQSKMSRAIVLEALWRVTWWGAAQRALAVASPDAAGAVMLPLLAAVFLVVPIAEIYLLLKVGHTIGALPTVALLIADSLLGAWLVRREARRAWRALREAMREGRVPAREATDAVLVVVGGALLLTPGFLTDALGLVCLLPVTRPAVRRLLLAGVARRVIRRA